MRRVRSAVCVTCSAASVRSVIGAITARVTRRASSDRDRHAGQGDEHEEHAQPVEHMVGALQRAHDLHRPARPDRLGEDAQVDPVGVLVAQLLAGVPRGDGPRRAGDRDLERGGADDVALPVDDLDGTGRRAAPRTRRGELVGKASLDGSRCPG